MASPQLENGYTKISNELLEAWMHDPWFDRRTRAFAWIIRNTYGWQCKETRLSAYQLAKDTGMAYSHAKAAIRMLKTSNRITTGGIQKDYEQWGPATTRVASGPGTGLVPKMGTGLMPTPSYRKEILKEKQQNGQNGENGISAGSQNWASNSPPPETVGFLAFWEAYPRKEGRFDAAIEWNRLRPDLSLEAKIMSGLKRQMPDMKAKIEADELRFILHPANWLRKRKWTDEVKINEQTQRISSDGIVVTRRFA